MSDLYYASMSVSDKSAAGSYGYGKTFVTLQKSFSEDDVGYHEVKITLYYGGGHKSITYYKYIFVSDD